VEPVPDDGDDHSTATAPTVVAPVDPPGTRVRVFGTRQFFRLWLAQVVSSLGDWLGFLAITLTADRLGADNPGAAIGLVMTARIVPGLFLAPVAGVLVDRWDRKKVMVVCDLGRAAVLCTLPFVGTVLSLVVASLVLEMFTLLWTPSKEASVPNLVPPERLASSNSLSLAAAYGTLPVASLAFTVLAEVQSWFDVSVLRLDRAGTLAFYVDALTFAGSALLIATLSLGPTSRQPTPVGEGGRRLSATLREFREGWSFIFVNPVVRAVNVGLATGLVGGGMVVPLGVTFTEDVLGNDDGSGYGLFVTALGLGAAVGIVLVSIGQRHLPKEGVFTLAVFGAGEGAGAAAMSTLPLAVVFVVGFGLCAGTAYVLGFTLLHENVDDELRGRIFSALYVLVRLCVLIAFAVGPFLQDLLDRLSASLFDDRRIELPGGAEVFLPGVRLTLWTAAAIIFVAGVLAALSLRGHRVAASDAP
jgi:dTMP kinase